MSFVLYVILFALFCAFSHQTKPVLHNLTQFTLHEDEIHVQVNFSYTGPVTRLAIWNCRASPTVYGYSYAFVWRKIVEFRSRKYRTNYVYTVEGPELGETCYRVCSQCEMEDEVWSTTKFISVLSYEEDEGSLQSLFHFTRKQLYDNTPYITHVTRFNRGYRTKFRINYTFKSPHSPNVIIFACKYTLEPFKFGKCKTLTRKGYNFEGTYKLEYYVGKFASGKLVIQACTLLCSPVYFFETKDLNETRQTYPYVKRVIRATKVGVTKKVTIQAYFDATKTKTKQLRVYAGHCHGGYNAISTPIDSIVVAASAQKKSYTIAFKKLKKGLWCVEACDGKREHGRCSFPVKFANFDTDVQLPGQPKVINGVKKSRFGYSDEVDITYAIPPSLFTTDRHFYFHTCQFTEVPFRVYDCSKVKTRVLTKAGPNYRVTIDKMPGGDTCVIACGYKYEIETCSLAYRIDNRVWPKKSDGVRINGVKKFTKFRYSNNINVFWHFSKEKSAEYDTMRIYTCQYATSPLRTRNYTLALQLQTDGNRVDYKFEIYNLPIGQVCLTLCGASNSAESCLSFYKFNNTLESDLQLQKSRPQIVGMKRRIKYGYSSGIMLEIKLSLSVSNRKFALVIHRCEYSLYPHYHTYNYTQSSRTKIRTLKEENSIFEVEGLPIGSACVQVCIEKRYTELCGVPFRVKNSRFGEENDYLLNRPQVLNVDRGVVEFTVPEVLHAGYNTVAVYRCKFRENPLRTYEYSPSMQFTVTDYVKTHSVMLVDDYTENECVQVCVTNEHFEKCGMPYRIK